MDWYLKVLKNYAGFSGRARRTEYWMFTLVNAVITIALFGLSQVFKGGTLGTLFLVLYAAYAVGVLIPSLAVTWRRLHDTGRSGWWYLLNFIPLVGGIILIVFLATAGQVGTNAYGADPKQLLHGTETAEPAVA
ncbi:MAG TPA: DUF805 domain-containing protein [Humibacillus sp.]|nr:DUF805 domain-containing protein [Humibacillus sp.]